MFDFKDMALKAIHDIGGCDATDEWSKGYDAGVNAAIAEVAELAREDARIEFIAKHYGFTSQANMLTEEAAEFTVALNKLRRGKPECYRQIKEEVADVLVIALQLRSLLKPEEIDKIMDYKIERQLSRIHDKHRVIFDILMNLQKNSGNERLTNRQLINVLMEQAGQILERRRWKNESTVNR